MGFESFGHRRDDVNWFFFFIQNLTMKLEESIGKAVMHIILRERITLRLDCFAIISLNTSEKRNNVQQKY